MQEEKAKSIVSTIKHGDKWFGSDYNMNLYRGCCHGCIYCDSRSSCYQVENFDTVRKKQDALYILNRELRSKKKKGVIGIGAMSDSYNPFEKEEMLTREALKLINYYGFGVSLETKSDLIVRDLDVFKKINESSDVILKLTITCADDALSKKIEPNVCVSSKRFAALRQISDAGIFCGVLMTPLLPFVNDDEKNIIEIVRKAKEAGAKFVFSIFGVTLRDNQRDYFFERIDALFPGMSFRYRQAFHQNYVCHITQWQRKKYVFEQACKQYGLLYEMKDIIQAYKQKKQSEQLQLF